MKKKFRKMTAVLLAMLLILLINSSIIVSSAASAGEAVGETEGRTGDCRWTLNALGTLTISGYGATGSDSSLYHYFTYIGWNREDVKEIIISWGVTVIGEKLFAGLENVTSVSIPDSVTKIENSAFAGCSKLERITIPDSVTTIYSEVFKDCTSLQTAIIGDSVEEISYSTFENCSNLENLTIGESVKTIWEKAFAGCIKLSGRLTIPNSVTNICTYAFSGCAAISDLTIGNSVESIDDYAFVNCSSLEKISMPSSIIRIGAYAFYNCNSLKIVYYSGNSREWFKLKMSTSDNAPLFNAFIVYGTSLPQRYICSDYKEDHNFELKDDEEIEDLVSGCRSNTYNPRLAHFLACMARSAYTRDLVTSNYRELGIYNYNQYHYGDSDPIAGYTIGVKDTGDGNQLVMITIRGSKNISEWLETNFNLGNSSMLYSHGWHSGFAASAESVYNSIISNLGSIKTRKVTYVITGHSLGAAAGNLLAIMLYEAGVSSSLVYDYNFACPNVAMGPEEASAWNFHGAHNNIINVGNWCDYVTHIPGAGMEFISAKNLLDDSTDNKWKRYGVSYWFNNGFQGTISHDMGVYLDYLEKEYDVTHFTESEYAVSTLVAMCPVDVVVYDSQGNPIAGTVNDKPNYYGYEEGEKAFIIIIGDKKFISLLINDSYEIRLKGTDNGEMHFAVYSDLIKDNDTVTQKWFKSVQLNNEKEMTSIISDNQETQYTQLFIVQDDNKKTKEILSDGSEVDPIFISENELKLSLGNVAALTAESEDTFRWYSTNKNVATVKDGIVTVKSYGEANIIAETVNGARAICKVIVPANCGDTDLDGKITISDVTEIQKYLAEFVQFTDEQLALADTDGDGKVDINDATHLQKYLAEYDGIVLGKQS